MMKRIVSGVFLLIALGALGLILAGALTSGEQLIVRFLTAIIVAALGLYVISDLRLQADDSAAAKSVSRQPVTSSRLAASEPPPPNSTAAFMATVTGKKSATTASLDDGDWSTRATTATIDPAEDPLDADGEAPVDADDEPLIESEPEADDDEALEAEVAAFSALTADVTLDGDDPAETLDLAAEVTLEDDAEGPELATIPAIVVVEESPYSQDVAEITSWPTTPDGQALADLDGDDVTDEEVDGLVAIFTKKAERELAQEPVLAVAAPPKPVLVGGQGPADPPPPTGDSTPGTPPPPTADDAPSTPPPPTADDTPNAPPPPTAEGSPVDPPPPIDDDITEASPLPSLNDTALNDTAAATTSVDDTTADNTTTLSLAPAPGMAAASFAQGRVIDLRLAKDAVGDIEAAIRASELEVISSLIDDGAISTDGPISDRDVRTMVYVAFTSSELRKILLAGGTLDGDNSRIDLGPVEVFSDTVEDRPMADVHALNPAPNGTETSGVEAETGSAEAN